ncbi:6-carboxytetrahydropterin synthase [Streptomyces finlayi]|uniref:6-carboxytetrahydropterin synthase n=1 Tax=Streptomyces finlayi TaxID=67296 RepID=UPI0027E59BE6|nr:6-carboxytetrahydropterin synthase [Streptomyces finlayi]
MVLELSAHDDARAESGFVRDFRDLAVFRKWVDATLDHRHLNEVMETTSPSAENLAKWIYDHWCEGLPELSAVKVSETPKTWVVYQPG